MKQLTVGDLFNVVRKLSSEGMTLTEMKKMPIYIGDDDELNGIHCGWFVNIVDANDSNEDNQYLVEMINEDYGNHKITGKAILIS